MQNIASTITKVIKTTVEEFSLKISEKHDIDVEDLEKLWNETSGEIKISVKKAPKTSKEIKHCPYIFQKGKDKKGTVCNAKVRSGGNYCSRHKHKENTVPKEIKRQSIPKKITKEYDFLICFNKKLRVYYDKQTSFVLKKKDDNTIVGKLENERVKSLTEEDIKYCKKHYILFEKRLLGLPNFHSINLEDALDEIEED